MYSIVSIKKFILYFILFISYAYAQLQDSTDQEMDFCDWPRPYTLARISPRFKVFAKLDPTTISETAFEIDQSNQIAAKIGQIERLGYLRRNRRVAIIVHGFRDDIDAGYMISIKDELLRLDDHTVILVGWEKGSYLSPFQYVQAASNSQTVADVIKAIGLAILNTQTFGGNKDTLYLYCIGHSVGAHVCGIAGARAGYDLFDRISGLDPAGPGFARCPQNPSLGPSSAACVDAVHTDGNSSGHFPIFPNQGALRRWGHIDFYPNSGVNQPGCSRYENDFRACSHHRSVRLFIFTMRSDVGRCKATGPCRSEIGLPDRSCTDGQMRQSMGYYSTCHYGTPIDHYRQQGIYYVRTIASEPYC